MNKKKGNEFGRLQRAIFLKTVLMLVIAFLSIYVLYYGFLQGHVAYIVIGIMERYIYYDYDLAWTVYDSVIRDNMIFFSLFAVLLVFLLIMRIYLNGFTKYFNEINSGIDALLNENAEDVVLSSELAATERKINSIKHTLEQRKLATELSEQRKNDLIVYLAHDLKTPLTSVIGYLNLLRDAGQISEELREKYLSVSLEKAEHLEDLINEFFDITRFNLSSITLEKSTVNLTRMLEQITYEFKPMFLDKELECTLEIEPNVTIMCDVDKMQRVFDNLLRNAVNYSYENGTIRITVVKNENNMIIRFTNPGNTIPKEKLDRIFEQFYRLDVARSSKSGGAGLGLAIAKEIVELHGGTINARSEHEEIEFEVNLPLL